LAAIDLSEQNAGERGRFMAVAGRYDGRIDAEEALRVLAR
jgi:hypothetical protein